MELQEAIAHARQVADGSCGDRDCAYQHDKLVDWLEELQHYRELKSQNRLIELPCKVGDVVFKIAFDKCWNGKCYWLKEGKCVKDHSPDYCPQEIIELKYSLSLYCSRTRMVFTQEEAQKELDTTAKLG